MARLTADRQLLRQTRLQVLDEEDRLWKENCGICTKIDEAVASGELPKETEWGGKVYWTCDRKNPVCDACPVHNKIRDCGRKLEKLTLYDRALR